MRSIQKPRSISIRDVAKRANVSLGSASRVINGVTNVTEETRQRVETAIAELGYKPNFIAQSLRSRSSRTIGCMLTDISNGLYARLYREFEDRLWARGYMLLLANGLNDASREIDILSTFRSRGMDGVILAPGNERNAKVIAAIDALEVPTVILDRDMTCGEDRVLFEQVAGVRRIVRELTQLNHKRIALILGQTPLNPLRRPMRRRIEGFRAEFLDCGFPVPEDLILRVDESQESVFEKMSALLALTNRPTAVIAQGTNILNECLNAINAAGLAIPSEVSVVSIGDPVFARTYLPPLATCRLSAKEIADASIDLLLSRINGEVEGGARTLRIPMEWVPRASCAQWPVAL